MTKIDAELFDEEIEKLTNLLASRTLDGSDFAPAQSSQTLTKRVT